MSCWIGGYIEAGAAAAGNKTPYLAFPFCGPATRAQAQSQAGTRLLGGPYSDQAAAQAAADAYNRNPANPKAGSGLTPGSGVVTGDTAPAGATGALTGVAAIGDFFQRLGQASTWIRVAETLLGLGLIIVGLAKLASGTPVGNAARKAGKAARIL